MPKTLSPLEFAHAECKNNSAGRCCKREDDCILKSGGRCSDFERCVLPLADKPIVGADLYKIARTKYLVEHEANRENSPRDGAEVHQDGRCAIGRTKQG